MNHFIVATILLSVFLAQTTLTTEVVGDCGICDVNSCIDENTCSEGYDIDYCGCCFECRLSLGEVCDYNDPTIPLCSEQLICSNVESPASQGTCKEPFDVEYLDPACEEICDYCEEDISKGEEQNCINRILNHGYQLKGCYHCYPGQPAIKDCYYGTCLLPFVCDFDTGYCLIDCPECSQLCEIEEEDCLDGFIYENQCSCCPTCLLGEGDPCGTDVPACGIDLVCDNQSETCICAPCNVDCDIGEEDCANGFTYEGCDCCPICLLGEGDSCGTDVPACGTDLVCDNQSETCTCAPCNVDCNIEEEDCANGFTYEGCDCCPTCLLGDGDSCGTDVPACGTDLVCDSQSETCTCAPCNVDCSIGEEDCANGFTSEGCDCCPTCLLGEGDSCGTDVPDCGTDLVCDNQSETCICACNVDCNIREEDCANGFTYEVCDCCPTCLLGPGDHCGQEGDLDCGTGLSCHVHDSHEEGCDHGHGVCIPDGSDDEECGTCEASECEAIDCPLGTGLDHCTCCDRCLGGPGDLCGGENNHYGECADGFTCEPHSDAADGHGECVC